MKTLHSRINMASLLGNCSLRRLRRLLLVPYRQHGPGQPLDGFPVSPAPCRLPSGRRTEPAHAQAGSGGSEDIESGCWLDLIPLPDPLPPGSGVCGTAVVLKPSWRRAHCRCAGKTAFPPAPCPVMAKSVTVRKKN